MVEWAPSIILRDHLPLYAQLGYHPASVAPCRRWGRRPGKRLIEVQWMEKSEPKAGFCDRIKDGELLVEEFEQRRADEEAERARRRQQQLEHRSLTERLQEQGVTMPATPRWTLQQPANIEFDT